MAKELNIQTEKNGSVNWNMLITLSAVILFIFVNAYMLAFTDHFAEKGSLETMGIIIAAGLSLALYSFLYADNPLFKFTEHLYVGISVGYSITYSVALLREQVWDPLFKPLITGGIIAPDAFLLIIPIFFGLCMFSHFFPKYSWIARYAFALFAGYGSGMAIPVSTSALLFKQTEAALKPFNSSPQMFLDITTIIVFISVVTVLVYFFFSIKHEGPVKHVARTGTYFVMISFGASFGFTVMARIALIIGQVNFLMSDWLGLVPQ